MKPVEEMTPEEKGELICKCLDIKLFAKILLDSERRKAEKAVLERQKAG
jgi:hypothetical protein